jgi:uncharacterized membrane protein
MNEEFKQEDTGAQGFSQNQNTASGAPTNAGVDNDKLWAASSYVLFFIPLLKEGRSAFVQFHANQGLLFFIFSAVGYIVFSLIPIVGWILLPFFSIGVLVFFILGLINALSGKMKRLPWIGHIEILK